MFAYTVEKDGTTRNLDNKIIFFPFEKFQKEICNEGHCFVCCAAPNNTFNDEHVFSNWILRKTGVHNEQMTLPNGNLVKYSTYKIPCCQSCNTRLGEVYETPISKVFSAGYEGLIAYLKEGGHERLCTWLSLIFLKVHLKDFKNKISLDKRSDDGTIGSTYDLHELHHVHALARAATVDIEIDERALGSLIILRVDTPNVFDYCDNLAGRTLMLRVNDIALIYVLDDCGATIGMLSEKLKTVPDTLSDIQLREIYARYVAANLHIKSMPTFRTDFFGPSAKPRVSVELPDFEIYNYEPSVFGNVFANVLQNYKDNLIVNGKRGAKALDEIATGYISFLKESN